MKTKFLSTVYLIPLLAGLIVFSSMLLYGQKHDEEEGDDIYFDNIVMEQFGWIGHEFTYDFNAKAKNGGEIRYELIKKGYEENYPEGMTIDEESGIVKWIPENNGDYVVMVRAYIVEDPEEEAYSGFLLMIRDSVDITPCAKVTGTVKDLKTGDPMADIMVFAISYERNQYEVTKFSSVTDAAGNYTIDVAKGNYMILASNYDGSRHRLYNNADNTQEADTAKIECEQLFVANFDMPEAKSDTGKLEPEIMFVTWPDAMQIKLGDKYEYQAQAKARDDKEVGYKLLEAPEGAVVDEATGVVTWVASTKGIYHFTLNAYIKEKEEESANQDWDIFVLDSAELYPCAFINGKVTDQIGDPVVYAWVTAISTDEARYYSHQEGAIISGETDHNGNYSLNVSEGAYIVFVEGMGFKSVVYGANGYMDTVSVKCDQTVDINLQVDKFYPDKFYHVTGRVTSAANGTPLQAMVQFYPEPGETDSLFIFGYEKELFIHTDDNGFYDIELPGVMKYVAFAIPDEYTYLGQFYLNASDFSEATMIEVKSDMSGIDFALKERVIYQNGFHGIVKDTQGNLVSAYVMAFLTSLAESPYDECVYSTVTDTTLNGEYSLSNLTPGKYVVMAAPMVEKLTPGFYVENDIATLNYEEATEIEIKENETLPNSIVITLPKTEGLIGISQLKGKIESNGGINSKGDDNILTTSPIAGALITASDKNNNTVDYCYSDQNGDYALGKIGVGQYKIQVSKVGYDVFETTLDFNLKEKNRLQKDIMLNPKSATSVDDPQGTVSSVKISPNPASISANLEFPGNGGKVEIKVVNLLGNEVLSMSVNTTAGQQSVKLATEALPNGTYIVKISGKDLRLNTILDIIR